MRNNWITPMGAARPHTPPAGHDALHLIGGSVPAMPESEPQSRGAGAAP